ncbi:hypothetical protein MHH52_04330 [Paenibacillus sp. FSL K6-0276]|uniref:hypothetical protein n=1 Tax=Paenibacillus sp. FSL K6-0276 TaxID=2921450 RepID=UPI0030EEABA6
MLQYLLDDEHRNHLDFADFRDVGHFLDPVQADQHGAVRHVLRVTETEFGETVDLLMMLREISFEQAKEHNRPCSALERENGLLKLLILMQQTIDRLPK